MSPYSSSSDLSCSPSERENFGYETDCTTPAPSFLGDHIENEVVEEFRDEEYPQLKGGVYLDHGGSTLIAKSLIERFSKDLLSNLYGNPHSDSTPSAVAGHRVDAVRAKALRFFKADPAEWDLVFVANATAAIKLTSECIRDHAAATNKQLWYGYHRDAHTSLVGIRETVRDSRCFTSDEEVEGWINCGGVGGPLPRQLGLFAYPGQSNMTGRRLPLAWPGQIRSKLNRANTYTLLDAAALASTASLDLSNTQESPDFVALSFYKIFGFPNVGALLVQKRSAHVLSNRRYFGGGTVDMVISINDTWHARKTSSLHDALEDGTLPFHSIFALDHAMDVHEKLYGPDPMTFISRHTSKLAKQLHDGLTALRHRNGTPVIRVYKETNSIYGDSKFQGATVSFNVLKANGDMIGYTEVERAADERHIYVRSGSLCNPGGMATYLGWTPQDMRAAFASGHTCSNPTQLFDGRSTGVVRASLGAMSTSADVRCFLAFVRDVYLDTKGVATPIVANAVTCSPRRASLILVQPPSPTSSRRKSSIRLSSESKHRPFSWDITAPTETPKTRILAPALPRLDTSIITSWEQAIPSRPRPMALLLPTPDTPTRSNDSLTVPVATTSKLVKARPAHLTILTPPMTPITPTNTNDSTIDIPNNENNSSTPDITVTGIDQTNLSTQRLSTLQLSPFSRPSSTTPLFSTAFSIKKDRSFLPSLSRRNSLLSLPSSKRYSQIMPEVNEEQSQVGGGRGEGEGQVESSISSKRSSVNLGFKKIKRVLTLSRRE